MKNKNDPGTLDLIDEIEDASALKNKNGEMCIPTDATKFLNLIVIHAKDMSRDPVELVKDIHESTGFWLMDRELRDHPAATFGVPKRGLNS